ncbi:unnamed protein product [Adineta steineri]|uniref:Uncharacterized protein n=1 Tax=Adineta steineri TaxID=433720 RepID=A0A815G1R7_9BILA|nr:unnamed protein product [Adineta steineri]CAF3919031.1 unnamed protein product [Adineta steineri]
MSEAIPSTKTAALADQLPNLPETYAIEPLVQCGVLYLGTTPSTTGLRGLDSIQEPFSHRYPVDGTNTVRGIDAVLSIYDNGIQLTFTRQPHVAVFFSISSLIYCASLRFSIIENDPAKPTANVDWRFMTLDAIENNEDKHPPLFGVIMRRTQVLPGNECHCFITKNTDAAFALVRTISQVYANMRPGAKCLKSPIFYQLDRFGRKISETTGIVYISPANEDDLQLSRINSNRLKSESIVRKSLLDPSLDGFYYRTILSVVEQWQLWDDNDLYGSRPHPPDSPFGLHEGLYHDDTTEEVQRYLRHMDDEDHSCACTCSSKSSSSLSSISTEFSRRQKRHRHSNKQKLSEDTDQFNESLSQLQASSFEPVLPRNYFDMKEKHPKPIIIEKVVPKRHSAIPILHPQIPRQSLDSPSPMQDIDIKNVSTSKVPFTYSINKRGEKISQDGNRIVYMDSVRLDTNKNPLDQPAYIPLKPRSRRQRKSRRIPVVNLSSIEKLFDEKQSKTQTQRRTSLNIDHNTKEHLNHTNHLTAQDMLAILDEFFENNHNHKVKLDDHELQSLLDQFESFNKQGQQRKNSLISSTDSSKSETRYHRNRSAVIDVQTVNYDEHPSIPLESQNETHYNHRNRSAVIDVQTVNYGERPSIPLESQNETHYNHRNRSAVIDVQTVNYGERSSIPVESQNETHHHHRNRSTVTNVQMFNYDERSSTPSIALESQSEIRPSPTNKQTSPTLPELTNTKLNEYVSDIYGAAHSLKSTTSSNDHQEIQSSTPAAVINANYVSAFRYMHSSVNPNYLEELRNAY